MTHRIVFRVHGNGPVNRPPPERIRSEMAKRTLVTVASHSLERGLIAIWRCQKVGYEVSPTKAHHGD